MSLIYLIVLFLIFIKDVKLSCWSITLYLFIYLSVIASALYSFLRLSCRNFLFRHFTVQLCSILGLRDPCGVTHAVTPTVNPALPTLPYTATSPPSPSLHPATPSPSPLLSPSPAQPSTQPPPPAAKSPNFRAPSPSYKSPGSSPSSKSRGRPWPWSPLPLPELQVSALLRSVFWPIEHKNGFSQILGIAMLMPVCLGFSHARRSRHPSVSRHRVESSTKLSQTILIVQDSKF